ncbi:MAG: hypothetical protein J6R18_05740 [Kiritimatiellae bacterium]|nr:hypothetical protein [Kiritimatiellia bacterium]
MKTWIDTGEWINWVSEYWKCPDCEGTVAVLGEEDIERYNFCPYCGARRIEDE